MGKVTPYIGCGCRMARIVGDVARRACPETRHAQRVRNTDKPRRGTRLFAKKPKVATRVLPLVRPPCDVPRPSQLFQRAAQLTLR